MNSELDGTKPEKAYKNLNFLNSNDARSIRVLCELIEPEQRLRNQRVENTVVFFGSARSISGPDAKERARLLREQAEGETDEKKRARLERSAHYSEKLATYYDSAALLAERITEWSNQIERPEDRFYICSGGGPGMMEAANKGALLAKGKSIGLGISLPFEQSINEYCTPDLSFEFHYFFMRKYWFLYLAKALVVFPGGFGTMDELFEILTLLQTRKARKHLPIVLFGSEFWEDILQFENFLKWDVIAEEDLSLFRVIDDVDEAADYLISDLSANYLGRSR